MDFKVFLKAVSIKLKKKCKLLRLAAKSYVSLFLVLIIGTVSTAAWFTSKDIITVSSQTLKMTGSTGMHDDSMQTRQTDVIIQNFRLEEASSVDGRNIFFPSSFVNNASDEQSPTNSTNFNTMETAIHDQTEEMVYREGNAGDKNVRYAYADTSISAVGADTYVWIKGYKVKIGNNIYQDKMDFYYDDTTNTTGTIPTGQYFPDTCPVRIAIIDDSGKSPKVFDPSARVKDYVRNTNAIYSITTAGVPTTRYTKLDSFATYYYGTNNPLFVVPNGTTRNITVVAWLEGTHPHAKQFENQEMTVEIQIETNVSDMELVYLHDDTVDDDSTDITKDNYKSNRTYWMSGNVITAMSYYDDFAKTYKTTIMKSVSDHVYQAAIPKYVTTDISFYRLSNTNSDVNWGTVFNSWHTRANVKESMSDKAKGWATALYGDIQQNRKIGSTNNTYTHYYAIRGNGYGEVTHNDPNRYKMWLSPCVGYWGSESGLDGDQTSTTVPSTTAAATQSTTQAPSGTYTIQVSLNYGSEVQGWVENGATVFFHLSNGTDVNFTNYSYGRATYSNYVATAGMSIQYIGVRYNGTKQFTVVNSQGNASPYTLEDRNPTFTIINDTRKATVTT